MMSAVVSVGLVSSVGFAPSASAQGNFQAIDGINIYMAVGPASGEPGSQEFTDNMMATMRGLSATPTVFLPSGSHINVADIITYDNNSTGGKLYIGVVISSKTPFTFDDVERSVGDRFGVFTNPIVNISFGPKLYGEDPQGNVLSGSGNNAIMGQVFGLFNTYSEHTPNPASLPQTIQALLGLYGPTDDFTAQYSLGSMVAKTTVTLDIMPVPEPSTWAFILCFGGFPILFRSLGRRESSA